MFYIFYKFFNNNYEHSVFKIMKYAGNSFQCRYPFKNIISMKKLMRRRKKCKELMSLRVSRPMVTVFVFWFSVQYFVFLTAYKIYVSYHWCIIALVIWLKLYFFWRLREKLWELSFTMRAHTVTKKTDTLKLVSSS